MIDKDTEMETNSNSNSGKGGSRENLSDSRRRLIKGAAVAPILMTVVSRPVLGAQCTPSAWVSGNLSDHGHERDTCGGRSPGYWQTNRHNRWAPTGYYPGTKVDESNEGFGTDPYKDDGTKFHAVFAGTHYGNKTLMQVLWLEGHQDQYQLGAHIAAALLNAASIPDYGMSVDDVKEMYKQLELTGYYQPSAGDPMTPEAVVLFIQNTFS